MASQDDVSGLGPNRRAAERLRTTLIAGRIYFDASQPSLDCQIRNISEEGACLKGLGVADVPDRFSLEIPARNRIFRAYVRWRKVDLIGVYFEMPQAPASPRRDPLESENQALQQRIAELSAQVAALEALLKGS